MRKLLCMLTFLLCLTLHALAEESLTVPKYAVGEWQQYFLVSGDELRADFGSNQPNIVITADGVLTFAAEDAPCYPLLYDDAADGWYIQHPDSGDTLWICGNYRTSDQLVLTAAADQAAYYIRTDASPVQLRPTSQPGLAFGGTWSLHYLYVWNDTSDETFAGVILLSENCYDKRYYLDTLSITLPAFPGVDTIQQAWTDAVTQYAGPNPFPFQALGDIYGYEMLDQYSLLLVTPCGMLVLRRTHTPEIDSVLAEHAEELAGWWYPEELSVGSIYLPPSMMGISDDPICIDEQGYVRLADGTVTALRLEGEALVLGEYPVSGSLSLTLAEDVELDFISEADWYRRQLNGDWQLSRISVPALGMDAPLDPAVTDVTLNIDPYDDWCVMDSQEHLLSESWYDVTEFRLRPLYGDDIFTLTIVGHSTLHVVPDSGSYTLTFTRINNTDE